MCSFQSKSSKPLAFEYKSIKSCGNLKPNNFSKSEILSLEMPTCSFMPFEVQIKIAWSVQLNNCFGLCISKGSLLSVNIKCYRVVDVEIKLPFKIKTLHQHRRKPIFLKVL